MKFKSYCIPAVGKLHHISISQFPHLWFFVFLLRFTFHFMCGSVCIPHTCECQMRPAEGTRIPGAGVTKHDDAGDVGVGN